METPKQVSYEEAEAMLPEGEDIHTFIIPGIGTLIGADWSREKILAAFRNYGAELSGEMATRLHHGLVFHDGSRYIFVATKEHSAADAAHGSGLSDEANLLVPKSVDRMLVLAFIKEERRGRTLHEVAFLMGKQVNSVSPRITELLKEGLIVRDGRREFHGHTGSVLKAKP